MNLQEEQKYLMSFACVNPKEIYLLEAFPDEKHFLFGCQNDIRQYGEYSNTPLEGTNFGLKHSSISTHPGLSMDSSMMILSVQSDKDVKKTHSKVIKHCKRHCLKYRGEIHDKLTRMASSMTSNIIALVDRYECI